ncbi:hypothetical protein C8R46DRAFT_1054125 [Mycena filopes]|nr:hypothetical protein C8R46DRAFT_1054125 [Mycena filopes]
MADVGKPVVVFVHNAPPEDHDLKRQYLALLPPQQVIDICLTLDIHVPVALKRNIWPTDFRAVIASMQNLTPKPEETTGVIPSVNGASQPPQRAEDKEKPPSSEPKPPDKQPAAGPSTLPMPALQPYGFSTQPAYPHTPYYQALPPGFAAYSYPTYPPILPHGFPNAPGYPAAQPFPPTAYPQYQRPPYPQAQETTIPVNPTTGDTDLPSYEDMIAEGLLAINDPEGMAPKDLFNWMAGRYPVQSNFRPSASQALQKAYKRGRFGKSLSGKYFLNALWDGSNSSTRRATRRPQAANAVPAAQKARMNQEHAPPPPQPPASQPMPVPVTPAEQPKQTPPIHVPLPEPTVPPNTAYAAAQKILQTINFGGVFKLEDEEQRAVKSEAVSMSLADHARAELQSQLALLAAQLEEIAQEEAEEDEDEDMEEVV